MKDLKAALGNASKPDLTHVRSGIMRYIARACEYGSAKYVRGNFLRPTQTRREDFERFRAYLRADLSHTLATLDAMEKHLALDPELQDWEGMKRAAYAADTDETPGAKVGASNLPHVAHGAASKMMAIEQAIACGLLPWDTGVTWFKNMQHAGSTDAAIPVGTGPVTFSVDGSGFPPGFFTVNAREGV